VRRRQDRNHRLRQARRHHHDPRAAAAQAANPAPTIAPAPEAETEAEAEERQRNYEQQRKAYEEEQERKAEERRQQEQRRDEEYEAERARKEKLQKARTATFERIIQNAPATFTPAQFRVLLRALVNLDPYTFTDDLAEEIAGENENEQRTAEEVLLSAIDGLQDDKITGFALRLALTGHVAIPREGEFDFLAEAEAAFAPPQPKNAAGKKPKVKTPTPIKAASKPAQKKTAAKKKTAA
jgi:ParB family chromosome partitioning protein